MRERKNRSETGARTAEREGERGHVVRKGMAVERQGKKAKKLKIIEDTQIVEEEVKRGDIQ